MRSLFRLTVCVASVANLAACGVPPTATSPSATLTGVIVVGTQQLTSIGLRTPLSATATYSDKTIQVVTTAATWQSTNPAAVSVSASGVATAVGPGFATITATYQGVTGGLLLTVATPNAEVCLPYNSMNLSIGPESDYWLLTDGTQAMFIFDTEADAEDGLAVARRYFSTCYIGRNNARADRLAYIVVFWRGPTAVTTTISPEDCTPYITANLQVVNLGASGWGVSDGSRTILTLDNQDDANAALAEARAYSSQCFVGRGNTRKNPLEYTLQYWK